MTEECTGCEGSGWVPNDCGTGYTEYLACMDCLLTGRVLSAEEWQAIYDNARPGKDEEIDNQCF